MLLLHLLIMLAWAAYGLIHSLLAAPAVKNKLRMAMGNWYKYYRLVYSLIAIVLLLLLMVWQVSLPSPALWHSGLANQIPGATLALIGFSGMTICLKKYLVSPEGFADLFFEGKKPDLQKNGLHGMVRHPLYLSTFIFLIGFFLMFPFLSVLEAVVVIIVYTVLAIPLEEKKLVELYGEEYLRYREQVPALLPRWGKSH